MNKILITLLVFAFSNTSFAFMGKSKGKKLEGIKECKTMYVCKDKREQMKADKVFTDEEVSSLTNCWSDKLACNKSNHQVRFDHMKTKVGKKNFSKKKEKRVAKLSEKIKKTEERLEKANKKLAALKQKATTAKMTAEAKAKLDGRTKLKEARVGHLSEKIKMLNDYKSQIEALN